MNFKRASRYQSRILHTRIDLYDGMASLELAYEAAQEFGVSPEKAKQIARQVGLSVRDWHKEALQWGASKEELEKLSTAFEHGDLHRALKGM